MVLMAGGVRSSWEEWEGARSRVVSLGLDTRDSLNTLDGQRIIVIIPGGTDGGFSRRETRAANDPSVFTITENNLMRAFSCLKVPTSAFTFKTLLNGH